MASREWKSIHTSQFAIRKGTKQAARTSAGGGAYVFVFAKLRKDSEAKRRQTQGFFCRAVRARPRLERQAHIYRRSTAVLVPRSLSSQGTQHQAVPSWDVVERVSLSVERALPAPTCPSPATKRALVVMLGGYAQSRPGAGCKSARGHRTRPRGLGMPPRPRPTKARFGSVCIRNGD